MANLLKGEAQLRGYTLAFNFGVFCSLEEKLGKRMPQILETLTGGLGFGELRDFMLVGLETHHPAVTEAEVLKLLDETGYKDAMLAISKAIGGFFGENKEKGANPTKAAQ